MDTGKTFTLWVMSGVGVYLVYAAFKGNAHPLTSFEELLTGKSSGGSASGKAAAIAVGTAGVGTAGGIAIGTAGLDAIPPGLSIGTAAQKGITDGFGNVISGSASYVTNPGNFVPNSGR